MSENVVVLTSENWKKEVIEADGPVLVDFWAAWCAPCRMIAPAVEQVAETFAGRAKVGKLNVDENPEIAGEYGIRSIPTLLVFKGGQVAEHDEKADQQHRRRDQGGPGERGSPVHEHARGAVGEDRGRDDDRASLAPRFTRVEDRFVL